MPSVLAVFPALYDFLKITIFGVAASAAGRLWTRGSQYLYQTCFLSVEFTNGDQSYYWILAWLSQQPTWRSMRNFEISTLGSSHPDMVLEEDETSTQRAPRRLSLLPSSHSSYHLLYKGRWVQVKKSERQMPIIGMRMNALQTLHLSIMTRNPDCLSELLKDARQNFIDSQDNKLLLFSNDSEGRWDYTGCWDKRSMDSIILADSIKEKLLQDARDFLSSRAWYKRRGIPFRRGYLLFGPPGTGKTSVIHAIAGELHLNLYVLCLSAKNLDDTRLAALMNRLPENCVTLIEDIDAAFTRSVIRDPKASSSSNELSGSCEYVISAPDLRVCGAEAIFQFSRITLSGLLNILDGVGAKEGRLLFATTNHYERLDAALTRPGRMDLHIELRNADSNQAERLFIEFYSPHEGEVMPPRSIDATEKGKLFSNKALLNSASASIASESTRSLLRQDVAIKKLAHRFSEMIPSGQFSIATLQGYLMTHRTDPVSAVQNSKQWVSDQLSKAEEKTEVAKDTLDTSVELGAMKRILTGFSYLAPLNNGLLRVSEAVVGSG